MHCHIISLALEIAVELLNTVTQLEIHQSQFPVYTKVKLAEECSTAAQTQILDTCTYV